MRTFQILHSSLRSTQLLTPPQLRLTYSSCKCRSYHTRSPTRERIVSNRAARTHWITVSGPFRILLWRNVNHMETTLANSGRTRVTSLLKIVRTMGETLYLRTSWAAPPTCFSEIIRQRSKNCCRPRMSRSKRRGYRRGS